MSKPVGALWMPPALAELMLDPARERRLDEVLDVVSLDERTGDVEVLLTSWGGGPVDGAFLARAPRLRLVAHAAGSVKALVSPEVYAAGVRVSSAAEANAIPVAEYTLAMILLSGKNALGAAADFRNASGNFERTVGVIGASRVGRKVLELLQPHDFTLLVADPYLKDAELLRARVCDLDDLLAASDVVTLHAPALDETRHLIDRRRLSLMRDGAVFVNTSRGSLVDHDALNRELWSGRISAVLDVTEPEPLPADSPLWDCPNVLITPHVAGSMGHETRRLMGYALDEAERWARGLPLVHEVRLEDLGRLA